MHCQMLEISSIRQEGPHWYIADLLALRHWKMSRVVMVITSEHIEFITSERIEFITSAEGTSDKFNASRVINSMCHE